jgi:hypothetical protein
VKKVSFDNLQVVARVRQIETFVDQRKIGDDVFQNSIVEGWPVGE